MILFKEPQMNTENICDIEVDGIDTDDYPDFCDAYISSACWENTGVLLTEDELDELNRDYPSLVYDAVMKHLY